MKKKWVGLLVVLTLGMGTVWVAYAGKCDKHHEGHHAGEQHKKCKQHKNGDKSRGCGKLSSSACSEKKCILKQRKECVCFYLKNSEELGLSEKQISELKKLKKESKTVKIRNQAEVEIIKLEIDELLDAEKPELDEINAKFDKIAELKAAIKKGCVRASVKARGILTKEQFKLSKKLDKICKIPPGRKCDKARTE